MLSNVSDVVLILLVIVGGITLIIKRIRAKAAGTPIKQSDFLLQVRIKIVDSLLESGKIRAIEANGGRQAAIMAITDMVVSCLSESDLLTEDEKILIKAIGIDSAVQMIVKYLEDVGILAKENVIVAPVEVKVEPTDSNK